MAGIRPIGRSLLVATMWVVLAIACRDMQAPIIDDPIDSLPDTTPRLDPLLVSDPVAVAAPVSGLHSLAADPVAWVSLPEGSIPNGDSIVIANRRTTTTVRVKLTRGGFDPVSLTAVGGDTLDLTVQYGGGLQTGHYIARVPERTAPVVVRTVPPPGRRDVPLNAIMLFVFSEPVGPSALAVGAIEVRLGGAPVAGALAFADDDHLTVSFTPAAPLQAGTQYQLRVARSVLDGDGDTLAAALNSAFTTVRPPDSIPQPAIAALYERSSPLTRQGWSRLVFTSTNRFSLETHHADLGFFEHAGSFSSNGDSMVLSFDQPLTIGPEWVADVAVSDGDSQLSVSHTPSLATSFPYIEDGGYTMAADPDPAPASGGRIAFTSNRFNPAMAGELHIANADGSNLVRLGTGFAPAWSRDGTRLAFQTFVDTVLYIVVMDDDGSNADTLGPGRSPAWSPLDTSIAFLLGDSALMVMRPDGSARRLVLQLGFAGTPAGAQKLQAPAWSPDGTRLAFHTYGGDAFDMAHNWFQVFIADAATGGNVRRMNTDGWSTHTPVWVTDDQLVVYTYDPIIGGPSGAEPVIARYSLASGTRQLLYRVHMQWFGPGLSVSPDGRYVIFSQSMTYGASRGRLLIIDTSTGIVRPFLGNPTDGITDAEASWSIVP